MEKQLELMSIALLVMASCSDELEQTIPDESKPQDIAVNDDRGIVLQSRNLTVADAVTVAEMFYAKHMKTREEERRVKNIVPIFGKDSLPAIYAVNFDDGYIMVSATTLMPPILGEAEHGNYQINKPETGEDVIIAELLANIDSLKEKGGEECDKYRSEWISYLKTANPYADIQKTRAMDDDEYWEALDSWYFSYDTSDKEVCNIVSLRSRPEAISEEEYNYIYESYFYDQDAWEGTDYRWENTAYLVIERHDRTYNVGPLLKTKWNQDGDYNTTGKDHLGCVPVAVGQIMRFFEYPSTINWSDMPYGWITPELTDFLASLSNEICGSGHTANISDAKKAFERYGYNVRQIKHSSATLIDQIGRNRCPVFASGRKNIFSSGHAWVIDGVYYSHSGSTYKLYYLDRDYYPDSVYRVEDLDLDPQGSEICKFHMNWGWGVGYDAWYFASEKPILDGNDLSYDRKDLIVNP